MRPEPSFFCRSFSQEPPAVRSISGRIEWLCTLGRHLALGGLAGITLSGVLLPHSDRGDLVATAIGAGLYLWNARRKGYL